MRLAAAGHRPLAGVRRGAKTGATAGLQAELAQVGYPVPRHGRLDRATRLVIAAFQRHFRPERVDGLPDRATLARLDGLLAAALDDLTPAPDDATSRVGQAAGWPLPGRPGGGKSGLHGNTVPGNARRGRPQGKCHREQSARRGSRHLSTVACG